MKKTENEIKLSKIIRGTLIKRFTLCGNKNCRCHTTGKKHGPNWYVVYSENKKTQHIYIPKKLLSQVREYIKNYNTLWNQINKHSKLNLKKIKEEKNNGKKNDKKG